MVVIIIIYAFDLTFVHQAVVNAIDKLVKWVCVGQGLSAATISTDVSEASGISKVWDSVELSEMRTEDKILWAAYEQNLFNLMRVVNNTHSKDKLSDSAILKVNFADRSLGCRYDKR